jgi:release factor glutamine methyltransferase
VSVVAPVGHDTVAATLVRAIDALATSESPRADALLLLAHVIARDRAWIVAHGEATLSRRQAERFAALCDRRVAGLPIAYCLRSAGFYGREFVVDERVLVPRPETEHLVDEALQFLAKYGGDAVLDAGTGSGAIACTIAAENANVLVDGTDTSLAAIAVARRNARRLGVAARCRFHHGSLALPVRDRAFDAIVANLPYVPSADVAMPPESAGFEPRCARDGGRDGLDVYRAFLPGTPRLLAAGGLLVMEAAPPVIDGLAVLASATFPGAALEIGRDYAGLARYVKVVAPPVA